VFIIDYVSGDTGLCALVIIYVRKRRENSFSCGRRYKC